MKKNKMMRLASGLLVAVLITTSMISGTFAKYVTTAEGSDKARVARFGVEITANGDTFATEYATDDENVVGTIAKSVVSYQHAGEIQDVVAPGTKGEMVKMTLTGTPEVAVNVSYEATTFEIGDNWKDADEKFYFPINITIGSGENTTVINGGNFNDAEALEAEVKAVIAKQSKDYAPHTNLADQTVAANALAISWEWPFSTNDGNDIKDTYLGNQAVAGYSATIELTVRTTVTQID